METMEPISALDGFTDLESKSLTLHDDGYIYNREAIYKAKNFKKKILRSNFNQLNLTQ